MIPSPIDVCFLTISSILFIMYVVFLISLVVYQTQTHAPLRSGFFKLTFMLGVFDVLQMAHTYIFLRFPSFGWMTDEIYLQLPQWVVHYGSCAMWALAFNQHIAVTFIAVNRFSAVVFPHEHRRRWKRPLTRILISLITMSGPIFVMPKVFWKSQERYHIIDYKTRASTIIWDDQKLLLGYKYSSFITLVIASLICLFCYCSIFYITLKRYYISNNRKYTIQSLNNGNIQRRRSSTTAIFNNLTLNNNNHNLRRKSGYSTSINTTKKELKNFLSKSSIRTISTTSSTTTPRVITCLFEKRELKLAACGFVIFVFMFIYTISVANMGVMESAKSQQAHRSIWLATSDLFSGINPILLIIVSKTLRNRFLAVLCCSWTERQYSPQLSGIQI